MTKLKYELVGKDLPKLYKGEQEPLLHYGESWDLAQGEGWVAKITSCGEIRAYKNGERISPSDLAVEYQTDKALDLAEKSGELKIENNNWYEVEVFADTERGYEYLDIMSDDVVCFSFDEALQIFNDYVNDEGWCEDLMKYVKEEKV